MKAAMLGPAADLRRIAGELAKIADAIDDPERSWAMIAARIKGYMIQLEMMRQWIERVEAGAR
jgi:hypothetical protein